MRLTLFCVCFAVLCMPAHAQIPPTFDVVGWCQDNVAGGAFQEDGVAGCIAVEQRKFRSLWALYRASPARARTYCESLTRELTAGRGSYSVLSFCLHDEMQNAR